MARVLIYRLESLVMNFFFLGGGLFLDKYGIWIVEVKRWTLFMPRDFWQGISNKKQDLKANQPTCTTRLFAALSGKMALIWLW